MERRVGADCFRHILSYLKPYYAVLASVCRIWRTLQEEYGIEPWIFVCETPELLAWAWNAALSSLLSSPER
jgi:hypothetical protein